MWKIFIKNKYICESIKDKTYLWLWHIPGYFHQLRSISDLTFVSPHYPGWAVTVCIENKITLVRDHRNRFRKLQVKESSRVLLWMDLPQWDGQQHCAHTHHTHSRSDSPGCCADCCIVRDIMSRSFSCEIGNYVPQFEYHHLHMEFHTSSVMYESMWPYISDRVDQYHFMKHLFYSVRTGPYSKYY